MALAQSLSCVLLWPLSLPPQKSKHILRREETGEGSREEGEKGGRWKKEGEGGGEGGKRMTPPGVQKSEELQRPGS